MVMERSSNPIRPSRATRSVMLALTSGSPPVNRIASTPRSYATEATRSISSKRRISERGSQTSPSSGMQ